jgi:hypothetical protein
MGAVLIFIDVSTLQNDFYGLFQLLFLMSCYAFVLFNGSYMISDSSEHLLVRTNF